MSEQVYVKIKRLANNVALPTYAHEGDVGMDLYAQSRKVIDPGKHETFFLGFALEFPVGYVGLVMDKGGRAQAGLKTMGGVFDAGYRGEYNVQLINLSDVPYTVDVGDKLAQLVLMPVSFVRFKEVEELTNSVRGEGRFGSTGKK